MKKSIVFLCLGLSACGFERSAPVSLRDTYPLLIVPATHCPSFYSLLKRALEEVTCVSDRCLPERHAPTLSILSYKLTSQPQVFGPNSILYREQLTLTVTFSWSEAPCPLTLTTTRARQIPNHHPLGEYKEKMHIEKDMQREIIRQLLQQLSHATPLS